MLEHARPAAPQLSGSVAVSWGRPAAKITKKLISSVTRSAKLMIHNGADSPCSSASAAFLCSDMVTACPADRVLCCV